MLFYVESICEDEAEVFWDVINARDSGRAERIVRLLRPYAEVVRVDVLSEYIEVLRECIADFEDRLETGKCDISHLEENGDTLRARLLEE